MFDLDQPTWPNGQRRPLAGDAPSKTWLKAKGDWCKAKLGNVLKGVMSVAVADSLAGSKR